MLSKNSSFEDEKEHKSKKCESKKKRNRQLQIPLRIFGEYARAPFVDGRKARLKLKIYSMEEVALHNNEESCWLIVNGLVLDVTQFLPYHPGQIHAVVKYGGQECDEHFAFHSRTARQLFMRFVIGRIHPQKSSRKCIVQ